MVVAPLHHPARIDHQNQLGIANRAESVGYRQNRASATEGLNRLMHPGFEMAV